VLVDQLGLSVGTLYGTRQNITLLATNAMRRAEEYKDVVVAWRNGAPVKLQEIATVIDSVENDKVASWYNDRRSVTLAVQRQPGANTVEVVDILKERLPTYRAQVPPAINLDVQFDRSVSIRESVEDVQVTLAISIGLVVLVIFLFLRSASATIIPALAVPVSLIGTCAAMYALGFSVNNMTMLALTHRWVSWSTTPSSCWKYRAPCGRRHAAVPGRVERQRNRLYDHLDHLRLARRVHSGAADGQDRGRVSASSR
jgi:multidrug efflux pump subunit AcrB